MVDINAKADYFMAKYGKSSVAEDMRNHLNTLIVLARHEGYMQGRLEAKKRLVEQLSTEIEAESVDLNRQFVNK